MSDIPSDFDYSLLLSDNLPPSDFPDPGDALPDSPSHHDEDAFDDELEAIHTVAEERRKELNRKGVVIQHRLFDPTPVFRSSSLPPDSPTPKRNARNRNPHRLPTTPTPALLTRNPSLSFRSSPPPMGSDAMPDDSEMSDATNIPETTPKAPPKFVPNFTLPLSGGGLFSKKITVSKKPENELKETTPPLPPASQTETEPSNAPPAEPSSPKRIAVPTSAPARFLLRLDRGPREVEIVTSSGETFKVPRKERIFRTGSTIETSSPARGNYYGIDIHGLLDEYQLNKSTSPAAKEPAPATAPAETGTKCKRQLLWTEKYRAKKFTDLVGDERTHRDVLRWLKGWDKIVFPAQGRAAQKRKANNSEEPEPEHRKILLLHGPPGLGKTTLAHVAARQCGYEPLEINASDDRTGGVVDGKIKDMLTIEGVKSSGLKSGKKQQANAGRPVCLIIDEIDGVTGGGGGGAGGGNEAGFIKALIDLILADQQTTNENQAAAGTTRRRKKKNQNFRLLRPIIAVCNDLYAPALKPLRQHAEVVQMRPPPMALMVDRLEWIFEKEGYATEDGAVRRIVELSSSGGSAARKGDMRGPLVNGEWIAARLKDSAKNSKGRQKLTRSAVEQELVGSRLGESDGKGSSGGRMVMRDALESVFHIHKERGPRRGVKVDEKKPAAKVQELIEGLGEFDKLTMDCFATYPTKDFNDDSILTKPNAVYEWLHFADIMSTRIQGEASGASYLSYPILAFHHLFASSNSSSSREDKPETEPAPLPFTGLSADWEAHEAQKEHTSMLSAIHSSITSIRLSQTFKNPAIIATELSPLVNRMLSPQINPVMVSGSGYAVASVRRDGEKKLVARAVEAMEACGVRFEKVRVEGPTAGAGWAFRMDPPLDAVGMYPTYAAPSREPVRYAVRQVLSQEWNKSRMLAEKAAREARMGVVNGSAPTIEEEKEVREELRREKKKVRKDFFGRIVEDDPITGDGGPRKKRRVQDEKKEAAVWVSYNEGFSNAVRKGIGLDELMEGLI